MNHYHDAPIAEEIRKVENDAYHAINNKCERLVG